MIEKQLKLTKTIDPKKISNNQVIIFFTNDHKDLATFENLTGLTKQYIQTIIATSQSKRVVEFISSYKFRAYLIAPDLREEKDAESKESYKLNDYIELGCGLSDNIIKNKTTKLIVINEISTKVSKESYSSSQIISKVLNGLLLKSYNFEKYKSKRADKDKKKSEGRKATNWQTKRPGYTIDLVQSGQGFTQQFIKDFIRVELSEIIGSYLTKDLVTRPANDLNPDNYVLELLRLRQYGIRVEVLDQKKLKLLGMNGLLTVGLGSSYGVYCVVLKWIGNKKKRSFDLATIGKGVTFDTGGISLKPGSGMADMKFDMAGSAAVVGHIVSCALSKVPKNCVGIVGIVENMPSSKSYRPSDVIVSASGQTIEVLNTDAEGRIVLSDLLWYCEKKLTAKYKVDLATLTGAMLIALGDTYAGFFSNNDTLAKLLIEASKETNELVWRLPLHKNYNKKLESPIADMANIADHLAGSITAAEFLHNFVTEDNWAHIDIAGTAWKTKPSELSNKGATGFGVRLLNSLLSKL